ncbi:MAG: hypothetical protein ACFB0E_09995 [Leptolyngbyaceae cyanobacterium]
MARSLDQISADLTKLESATEAIDQDFQSIYQEYLAVMGHAVKRQLILAAYHLCTQAYPKEFLALTVNQREKLQASLRQVALQGQSQIKQLGQATNLSDLASRLEEIVTAKYGAIALEGEDLPESEPSPSPSSDSPSDMAATVPPNAETVIPLDLTASEAMVSTAETGISSDSITPEVTDSEAVTMAEPPFVMPPTPENGDTSDEPDNESDNEPDNEPKEPDLETKMTQASEEAVVMLKRLSASLSLFSILGTEPLTPVNLAKRHVLLERHLRAILRTLSALANHGLKQANILPDLPEIVIAAATEAADSGESGVNKPNLLNVMVEMSDRSEDDFDAEDADEDNEDDEDDFEEEDTNREMTHLVAINLRLADIEFADHQAALWRGRLQETLQKLKRLGSRYQKLQQEKARAEAEHAWRAIWFEE